MRIFLALLLTLVSLGAAETNLNVTPTTTRAAVTNIVMYLLTNWPGNTNITYLGAISNGVWQGTPIGSNYIGEHFQNWNTITSTPSVYAPDTHYHGIGTPGIIAKYDSAGTGFVNSILSEVDYRINVAGVGPLLSVSNTASGGGVSGLVLHGTGHTNQAGMTLYYYDYPTNHINFKANGAHFIVGSNSTAIVFGQALTNATGYPDYDLVPWLTLMTNGSIYFNQLGDYGILGLTSNGLVTTNTAVQIASVLTNVYEPVIPTSTTNDFVSGAKTLINFTNVADWHLEWWEDQDRDWAGKHVFRDYIQIHQAADYHTNGLTVYSSALAQMGGFYQDASGMWLFSQKLSSGGADYIPINIAQIDNNGNVRTPIYIGITPTAQITMDGNANVTGTFSAASARVTNNVYFPGVGTYGWLGITTGGLLQTNDLQTNSIPGLTNQIIALYDHTTNTSNPHSVTYAQAGASPENHALEYHQNVTFGTIDEDNIIQRKGANWTNQPPRTEWPWVAITNAPSIPGTNGFVQGVGTVNIVAKFTGTNIIGDSQIYDDGTNVGIGTITPTNKVEIVGDLGVFSQEDNPNILMRKEGRIIVGQHNNSWGFKDIVMVESNAIPMFTSTGSEDYIRAGRIVPEYYLDPSNSIYGGIKLQSQTTPYGGAYDTMTWADTLLSAYELTKIYVAGVPQVTVNSNGLGIGTITPTNKLDVDGIVNITTGNTYNINGSPHTHNYEPALGNPASDGWVLTKTSDGDVTWVNPETLDVAYAAEAGLANIAVLATNSIYATNAGSSTYSDTATNVLNVPSHTLGTHYDTTFVTETDGQVVKYSSGGWINENVATNEITGLSDWMGLKSDTNHNHSGTYEPVLGNPDVSGKVLASTDAGVRSWVALPSAGVTGSGTDHYIPMWNGTTALENSEIYRESTYIGTTLNIQIYKSSPSFVTFPSATTGNGDSLGKYSFYGNTGSAGTELGRVIGEQASAWSGSEAHGRVIIAAANGLGGMTTGLTVTDDGISTSAITAINSKTPLTTSQQVLVPGSTTNLMVWESGILVSNIANYYSP